MEHKLTYPEVVSGIKSQLKRGDVQDICKKAGVDFNYMFYTAIKKKDWEDLSKREFKIIEAALSLIESRKDIIHKAESL